MESILHAGGDPWVLTFDPASSHQVLNMSVINGAFEGTVAYPLNGLEAASVEAWSLTQEIEPGVTIKYLPVLAFAYVDVDGDRCTGSPRLTQLRILFRGSFDSWPKLIGGGLSVTYVYFLTMDLQVSFRKASLSGFFTPPGMV